MDKFYVVLVERYMDTAQELAQGLIDNQVNLSIFKDGWKYAESSLNTVNIVDWFKRRTAHRADFQRNGIGYRFVDVLLEVRAWTKEQTDDIQQQVKVVSQFLGMVESYVSFLSFSK